ncbi:MAG: hypothetical protein WB495_24340 [Xanthobacteraceae bacterium]
MFVSKAADCNRRLDLMPGAPFNAGDSATAYCWISTMPVAKPIPDHAPDPRAVLAALWRDAGFDDAALDDVELIGAEPVLPSSFAVGTAAQATIAAAALAAAEVWRLRTGRRQRVSVDMRRTAIEFRSEHYVSVDGHGKIVG